MAFPTTALPLRVYLFPGADPAADLSAWPPAEDITTMVREEQGVTLSEGRDNEGTAVGPAQISMTLDNSTGDFVPRNPAGAYYPRLRRNCPIMVTTIAGEDTFTRTAATGWGTATGGGAWSVTGVAADWSVSGGKGLRTMTAANTAAIATLANTAAFNVRGAMTISSPVVPSGGSLAVGALARLVDDQNYYLLRLEFQTTGVARVRITSVVDNISTLLSGADVPGTFTAGQEFRLRWAVVGASLMAKAWPVADPEPDAWTTSVVDTAVHTGAGNALYVWRFAGNTDVVPLSVDDYTLEGVEGLGNVVEWPVRWDLSGRNATAPITAAGVLRRLSQGGAVLRSPLYRQLSAQNPSGYWPLEDAAQSAEGTVMVGSAVKWGRPATAKFVQFGAATDLPGATQTAQLTGITSRIKGVVTRRVNPGEKGFAFMFFLKAGSASGGSTPASVAAVSTTGRVVYWQIALSDYNIQVIGWDDNVTKVVDQSASLTGVTPTRWMAVQLETSTVAGTLTWALSWHQVGNPDAYGFSGSYASSSISSTTGFLITPGLFTADGLYVSHVFAGSESLPFVDYGFFAVANGYTGELASDRILRLCREESIPCYAEPGSSEPLGPQRTGGIVQLLRSAELADMGVLYESGNGLAYRPRSACYRRPVLLALDQTSGHLDEAPEPTDDDQRLRNDITVGRDGGAQGMRYVDEASVLADGRYDEGLTLNLASDSALQNHAAWRVYLGTRPDLRWPRIALNFARNPGLLPVWRSRPGWGPRLTMTGEMAQVRGDGPDVIVEGWEQTLTTHGWRAVLSCSPARPWDVPLVADTTSPPRAGSNNTTTTTSVTSTATTLPYTVAAGGVAWTTDAAQYPFDLLVGGEQVTATAATGSAFTVVRSVNGVVKAHDAGVPITLYRPTVAAL